MPTTEQPEGDDEQVVADDMHNEEEKENGRRS